jgi:hypothetical protein
MKEYIDLNQIKFEELQTRFMGFDGWHIDYKTIFVRGVRIDKNILGIDPGANFGVTILSPGWSQMFWGKLPKGKETVDRMEMAHNFIRIILGGEGFDAERCVFDRLVVEGPAYRKDYGQSKLAHIRAGWYLGARPYAKQGLFTPPAVPRKVVLGSGKKHPGDEWPNQNLNALDSLNIALYGAGFTGVLKEE